MAYERLDQMFIFRAETETTLGLWLSAKPRAPDVLTREKLVER
jgi:hypothetical protein